MSAFLYTFHVIDLRRLIMIFLNYEYSFRVIHSFMQLGCEKGINKERKQKMMALSTLGGFL